MLITVEAACSKREQNNNRKQTCLASAFSTAPHTGSIKPPKILISCNLLPTVQ